MCSTVYHLVVKQLDDRLQISQDAKRSLHAGILAVVGSDRFGGNNNWTLNLENVCLEIVRHALRTCGLRSDYDGKLFEFTHGTLYAAMHERDNGMFISHMSKLEEVLLQRLSNAIKKHVNYSSVDLFNSLTISAASNGGPPPPPSKIPLPPPPQRLSSRYDDQLSDIIRRSTHIAVLHWRIWAPIVYMPPVIDPACSGSRQSSTSSTSASWAASPISDAEMIPGVSPTPSPSPVPREWTGRPPMREHKPTRREGWTMEGRGIPLPRIPQGESVEVVVRSVEVESESDANEASGAQPSNPSRVESRGGLE